MRGSVVKKGTRWYVKIELDPDPSTGQRRQKWHSGYNTKREAERARIDLLSKFDRGEYVEPSHQTVADYHRRLAELQAQQEQQERAAASNCRRLLRRLAEGHGAHGSTIDV